MVRLPEKWRSDSAAPKYCSPSPRPAGAAFWTSRLAVTRPKYMFSTSSQSLTATPARWPLFVMYSRIRKAAPDQGSPSAYSGRCSMRLWESLRGRKEDLSRIGFARPESPEAPRLGPKLALLIPKANATLVVERQPQTRSGQFCPEQWARHATNNQQLTTAPNWEYNSCYLKFGLGLAG